MARAAAQGPLVPASVEREPEEAATAVELEREHEPEPEPEIQPEPELQVEEIEEIIVPTVRTFQPSPLWAEVTRATRAPEPTALAPDPYEELTRLATLHALGHTMPVRQADLPLPTGAPATEAAALVDTTPATSEPVQTPEAETPWPVGERRSAARQARKPLPAVLQAAVASGVTRAGTEPSAAARAGAAQPAGAADEHKTDTDSGTVTGTGSAKPPGLFRRYGSAILVLALFVAAGAAAIGIAWARGPVVHKPAPIPAQDQAAANKVVLGTGDFPTGWPISSSGTAASSYGVGSMFVTRSIMNSWLSSRPQCASALNTLSMAMTPAAGSPTALASSQAMAQDGLGGSWLIADAVAFHVTAAQVAGDGADMSALLASQHAMSCISSFWRAALLAELPRGSHVVTNVSRLQVPRLPGNPAVWAISMTSTATVGHRALPIQFEFTTFSAGRAKVSLASSAKFVPLNGKLDQNLLTTLATRSERFAS